MNFQVAKSHERELKRWLVLVAIYPDAEYIMLSTIDDLWHAFILFTKKYSDFCSQIIGRFIHHQSLIHREENIDFYRDKILTRYERFHSDYKAVFKENPPTDIWPTPDKLIELSPEKLDH